MLVKETLSPVLKCSLLVAALALSACAESKSKPNAPKEPAVSEEVAEKDAKKVQKQAGDKGTPEAKNKPDNADDHTTVTDNKDVVRDSDEDNTNITVPDKSKKKPQGKLSEESLNSLQLRRNAWGNLLGGGDMVTKMKEARVYISNFEFFQAQKNNSFTSDTQRSELLQQAAQEFLTEAEGLAPADGAIDVFAKPESQDLQGVSNKTASFNALAVSLSATDIGMGSAPNAVSFESLLAQGLTPKMKENPTGAYSEVLLHESTSVQLLQTRYNLLVWWFLARITNYDDLFAKKLRYKWFSWDLNLNQYNVVQLNHFLNQYLEPALRTKNMIGRTGAKMKLDSTVGQLLGNMKVKPSATKDEKTAVLRSRITQVLAEIAK